jgi:hypothetical protein
MRFQLGRACLLLFFTRRTDEEYSGKKPAILFRVETFKTLFSGVKKRVSMRIFIKRLFPGNFAFKLLIYYLFSLLISEKMLKSSLVQLRSEPNSIYYP